MGRPALAVVLAAVLLVTGAAPASAATSSSLIAGLNKLASDLTAKSHLSATERAALHREKAALIDAAYGDQVRGVTYAAILNGLDCVATDLQIARNAAKKSAQSSAVGKALACHDILARALRPSAPNALVSDLTALRNRIRDVAKAVKAGKPFGAKTRAVREEAAGLVAEHFVVRLHGVALSEIYRDVECIDVKIETGKLSGAASCAKRLRRLVTANAPPNPPITFGSDLLGDPVAMPGVWREDSEFWTSKLTIPAAGTITQFRLRIGAGPVALPIRFSVVRPQPDGRVKVLTTTNPPYMVPAGTPGTYTFSTSALSFKCCKVEKGDIVTVDNRGAEETESPYTWFARKRGITTFSHMVPGVSQDAGQLWTATPHADLDVLLEITMTPS